MTILKEFFGLLWTIAVVAFLVGLALGIYLGVKVGLSLDAVHAVASTAIGTGGGGHV